MNFIGEVRGRDLSPAPPCRERDEGSKNTTHPTDPGDHDSLGQKHMLLVSEQINDCFMSKKDMSLFGFSSKMTM